ncbi:MAG: hypothetical protein HOP19_27960 [Acidobacteria bacterium]|nr:hypothetical protein [Acidobacteriota bacterium]
MMQETLNEQTLAMLDEASEGITTLFEKYGVTEEDMEKALEKGAQITLAQLCPDLAKQAA